MQIICALISSAPMQSVKCQHCWVPPIAFDLFTTKQIQTKNIEYLKRNRNVCFQRAPARPNKLYFFCYCYFLALLGALDNVVNFVFGRDSFTTEQTNRISANANGSSLLARDFGIETKTNSVLRRQAFITDYLDTKVILKF